MADNYACYVFCRDIMQTVTEEEGGICWEETTKAWGQIWRICTTTRWIVYSAETNYKVEG